MSSKELRRWVAAAQDSGGQLIRLLVPARPSSLPPDDDSQEAADRASRLAALQLAAALCALQPGGPSISWPTATHQQVTVVVCGKANAALGYKALAANGAKLGFKLGDVKSTVVVLPMQYEELQRTAEAAVSHALQSQGWHRLGTMWVRSNFLATEPGRTAVVPATELSVQPASPSTGTMALGFRHAGMYKYCPVWPLPTPPPPAAPPAPTADAAAATAAATAAAAAAAAGAGESARGDAAAEREAALARLFGDKAALRRAVSRLSETRVTVVGLGVPAYIIALKPPPSNPAAAQRLRDAWLSRFGLRLPTALGGFVAEVAASPDADPDDAQDVPGCCLWIAAADGGGGGGGGLVPVPPAQCTAGPEQVSEQLLKDLVRASSASFAFWGSGGLTSQGEAAPPGAEAALAKRQAASAPAAPLPPAAAAAAAAAAEGADGSGGGENTGWTAAVEVVASGFRAAVSLAPAAQVLRRTIDPDIDGGGASGGGGANFGPVDLALAEALYGDEVAASGDGGGGGSAAAREAILERSSDEALRAAARARAANRATEKAAWGRCRTFWEARKLEEGGGGAPGGAPRAAPAGGGGGGQGPRPVGGAPRAPLFGSSARPKGLLGKGGAARPLLLKAPAAGKKAVGAAGGAKAGKAAGTVKAAAAGGAKAKATKAAKAAAAPAAAADGAGEADGAAAAAAAAPPPVKKRPAKAAATGADGAPAKKRAKTVAAAAAAPAPASTAADKPCASQPPLAPAVQQVGDGGGGGGAAAAAQPDTAVADCAAAVAVAADMYDTNDADDVVVQPTLAAAAPAPPTTAAPTKKSAAAAAGKGAKAAGAGGKRSAAAAAAPAAGESAAAAAEAAGAAPADAAAAAAGGAEAAAPAAAKEARKRTKASDLDLSAVEAKVAAAAASGRLSDLTLPEMQCWLRARKAPVSGKKADVETRLAALLGLAQPAAAAAIAAS